MKDKKQNFIVNALVTNPEGKILLVRRESKQDETAHNKWELPGGKIDFGEDPEETAVRETREETGYNIKTESLIPKIINRKKEFEDKESHRLLVCYTGKLKNPDKEEKSIEDHGVNNVGWFTSEEIKELECLSGTKEFIELFINSN